MLLIQNRSEVLQEVPILRPDGIQDSVFIQPRARVRLEEGASVNSAFHLTNNASLTVLDLNTNKLVEASPAKKSEVN